MPLESFSWATTPLIPLVTSDRQKRQTAVIAPTHAPDALKREREGAHSKHSTASPFLPAAKDEHAYITAVRTACSSHPSQDEGAKLRCAGFLLLWGTKTIDLRIIYTSRLFNAHIVSLVCDLPFLPRLTPEKRALYIIHGNGRADGTRERRSCDSSDGWSMTLFLRRSRHTAAVAVLPQTST